MCVYKNALFDKPKTNNNNNKQPRALHMQILVLSFSFTPGSSLIRLQFVFFLSLLEMEFLIIQLNY